MKNQIHFFSQREREVALVFIYFLQKEERGKTEVRNVDKVSSPDRLQLYRLSYCECAIYYLELIYYIEYCKSAATSKR